MLNIINISLTYQLSSFIVEVLALMSGNCRFSLQELGWTKDQFEKQNSLQKILSQHQKEQNSLDLKQQSMYGMTLLRKRSHSGALKIRLVTKVLQLTLEVTGFMVDGPLEKISSQS